MLGHDQHLEQELQLPFNTVQGSNTTAVCIAVIKPRPPATFCPPTPT